MGVRMKKIKKRVFKKSEKGLALVESIPVLFMIVVIFNFSLGFFGAIHSGILNSIASYNYTLETFRFRSNLMYFRPGDTGLVNYKLTKNRVHGVTQDGNTPPSDSQKGKWLATVRSPAFSNNLVAAEASHAYADKNNNGVWSIDSAYTPQASSIEISEIWIKTVYGICINADCGEGP